MEFLMLGPLQVLDEGRPLPLGAKQRALLAILLLNANEVVATDRLIDDLWGERPPATAAKALQVYVSRLRKALEPEPARPVLVVTRVPGYAISLEEGQLDVHRFETAVGEGRRALESGKPEPAARALDEALALWRGPPLADFQYERFAQGEIARLTELRMSAVADRIEADLALGRHLEVIGELEALLVEEPLRERLRGQLMLALYRSGRQAEALEAYRAARHALVEELGLEPSRQLQELHQAILHQDPSLDPGASRAVPTWSTAAGFVGREGELKALEEGLTRALLGEGGVFLIVGEPGIGKTRLAEELAARAREREAVVLWGRCWEAGGAPAYWPWVQALRSYVQGLEPEVLRAQLGQRAAEVAHIVPAVRDVLPDLPEPVAADSEGARFRLFDALAGFLSTAAAARPLVLVLDDLHAADTTSLLLLRYITREIASAAIFIAATYRDVAPTPGDALRSSLAELSRERVVHRIELGGLAAADVAGLIRATAGVEPDETMTTTIHAETEGNPLFVGEVVRLLASEGALDRAPGRLAIPAGVREAIGQRLGLVSDRCADVLLRASVIGRELDVAALERLWDGPSPDLYAALDEAIDARLLVELPGVSGRLRFSHALVRDALYDDLPATRRGLLHQRLGEALTGLYTDDPEPHLAELAHHFWAAAGYGGAERALDYARRAGDRAAGLLAYEEAARLYRTALQALEQSRPGDVATRCELLLAIGETQGRAGEGRLARETLLQAADAAREAGASEQLARAAVLYGGRFVWPRAISDHHLLPLLEEALSSLTEDDSVLRVKLLARLATSLRSDPSRERREALAGEAVAMARRIGDDATLAYALNAHSDSTWGPHDVEARVAQTRETIALAEAAGDPERAFSAHESALHTAWERGDPEAVETELQAMADLAAELRQPAQLWLLTVVRANRLLDAGDLTRAEDLIERAHATGQRVDPWSAGICRGAALLVLRRAQGRLSELQATHPLDHFASPLVVRCVRVHLDWDAGRDSEAEASLSDLLSEDIARLHLDEEWLFSMSLLVEPCVSLGDEASAAKLYDAIAPYAGLNVVAVPEVAFGSVDRGLGVLAGRLGLWEQAERHFAAALAMNARMGARPSIGYTHHDHAAMLLRRGRPDDRARAQSQLAAAIAVYRELGMDVWTRRAAALAPA